MRESFCHLTSSFHAIRTTLFRQSLSPTLSLPSSVVLSFSLCVSSGAGVLLLLLQLPQQHRTLQQSIVTAVIRLSGDLTMVSFSSLARDRAKPGAAAEALVLSTWEMNRRWNWKSRWRQNIADFLLSARCYSAAASSSTVAPPI
ncbi:hypothetical protein ACLOJK_018040 [Asimina triloba]